MPSDEKQEPKLPLQNVVLLVGAVAGAVWLYQGPLKSSRPVEELSSQRLEAIGDRRVQARLWQDPFDAVARHIESEQRLGGSEDVRDQDSHRHSLDDLAEEVARLTPAQVQVLVLLTDGAPYADPSESRLRQRYAVLGGFEQAGYVPTDGEHIRFFFWNKSGKPAWHHEPLHWRTAPVPVERYRSLQEGRVEVVVLWVKDQDLGSKPLMSLRAMQREVVQSFRSRKLIVSFKVIGPRFSGTLQGMVAEAKSSPGGDRLELYSPWSTAPEDLIEIPETGNEPSRTVFQRLKSANVTFIRTIQTDDLLIGELVKELGERRGVGVGETCTGEDSCDWVAIVAEWDTLYGRALPEIFEETAKTSKEAGRIVRFSYLRGLDGELPRQKGKSGVGDSPQEDDKATLSLKDRRKQIEHLERPEGRSQFDSVRRLAQSMKDDEERRRSKCPLLKRDCADFKAIGVLGSDVYDKLLILQALKQMFPQAIFFTTDLDARLFHPSELRWTRNLVVASHFGLALHDSLQEGIPPFRDTYQTATFYSVLRALDALQGTGSCRAESYGPFLERYSYRKPGSTETMFFEVKWRPRLHEIGKNGPVDLSIAADASVQNPDIRSIHQLRPSPVSAATARWHLMLFVTVVVVGWVLLIPASQTIYGWTRHVYMAVLDRPRAGIGALLVFAAIGAFVWWVAIPYLVSDGDKGEPFSIFDGVSIWPSQILRGLVVVLAALFIGRIWRRLRAACERVKSEFSRLLGRTEPEMEGKGRLPAPHDQDRTSFRMRLARLCMSDRVRSVGGWVLDQDPKEPSRLWAEYEKRMAPSYLAARVLAWSGVFLVIGQVAMGICGQPFVPFRGMVAEAVDHRILVAAVFLMVVVIFLVLDIMRMAGIFVRKLVSKDLCSVNPDDSLTKLQLVAWLTARIDVFIYYPAVLMALMLLARTDYLDNWDFPLGLIIVVGLGAGYVVASAVLLRGASEEARRHVLHELSNRLLAAPQPTTAEHLKQVMENISGVREGAFRPYTELPVFRAVALPSGAYGVVAFIEFMATNF